MCFRKVIEDIIDVDFVYFLEEISLGNVGELRDWGNLDMLLKLE